jgi:hypothetical protein
MKKNTKHFWKNYFLYSISMQKSNKRKYFGFHLNIESDEKVKKKNE